MGLWRYQESSPQVPKFKMMELYIETLTGTVFELRVSPFESIQDVKSRIQKLEGIPISQQNLIWQTQELDDDYSLQEYGVQDGATLKLVLTMRGGPINTRRVPVEDAGLREMAEYLSDAKRDELLDKLPGNRPVTVIVYQNGDQVNFFRVVDRDSTSPTSESLSGASMYNMYDEEDEDVDGNKEKHEDNDKTRGKMKQLRSKMENMIITKRGKPIPCEMGPAVGTTTNPPSSASKRNTPQLIPHPPSTGRPHSMSRLRRFPSITKEISVTNLTGSNSNGENTSNNKSAANNSNNVLNRNPCLPPVGQVFDSSANPTQQSDYSSSTAAFRFAQILKEKEESTSASSNNNNVLPSSTTPTSTTRFKFETDNGKTSRLIGPLTSVKEDESLENDTSPAMVTEPPDIRTQQEVLEAILRQAQTINNNTFTRQSSSGKTPRKQWDYSNDLLLKDSTTSSNNNKVSKSAKIKERLSSVDGSSFVEGINNKRPLSTSNGISIERLNSIEGDNQKTATRLNTSATPKRQLSLDTLTDSLITNKPPQTSLTNSDSTDNNGNVSTNNKSFNKRERRSGAISSGAAGGGSSSRAGITSGGRTSQQGRGGVILESLNFNEVRAMSGLLTSYMQRTSQRGPSSAGKDGRRTPDTGRLSGRGRLGSGREGRISPRGLAPMKHKKKSKRCFLCGKKTGLATSYQCRCGENFCATHRYAEMHNCTFDYKTEGRKLLQQSNPVVTAPKLPKI